MGVEPTRDRAERPLSRFEDGETHRGPYTSMCRLFCHDWPHLSSDLGFCDAGPEVFVVYDIVIH